jgi:putative ATP-binding cassette transporter
MKILAFLFKYSPRAVILAILAGAVSGATSTVLLAVIQALLTGRAPTRISLVWAFAALCLVLPLARVTSELLVTYLGQDTIYRMRLEMCRRILAVPLRRLEALGAPRLLAALTADIPQITNVVSIMPTFFINTAAAIGCLIYLGVLSWKMLLAALALIVVGVLGYQLLVAGAVQHLRRAREANDGLYQNFRAVTDGVKELKLHRRRRQAFLARSLEPAAAEFRREQIQGLRLYSFASSWGQLLSFIVIGFLLLVAPRIFTSGADPSTLTGYILILIYMMAPLQMIMNSLPSLGQAQVALSRIEALGLDLAQHATDQEAGELPEQAGWRSLELVGATLAYRREGEDGEFVLGPVDLRLQPAEVVFLVGGNGSGKTTLAKILVGLYVPDQGEVRLDGQPVTDGLREAYREHFSAIFSDFHLFEELFGVESPDLDERARRYLTELQIAHKVRIENGRLSSTELSQGQRKRLALLVSYLEDRPIYLFDEWAADQDPVFREIFYSEILPDLKRRGKACIVISHDDRYYSVADRIVKLDYGRVTQVYRPEGKPGKRTIPS